MSFFSRLFGDRSRTDTPADLSVLKCDVHSHFIPGIDDGAKSMDDAVSMIREFYELGYRKVITTPHIMTDGFRNTPEIILGGLDQLRVALKNENIPVAVEAAAEYYLDFDFERKLNAGRLMTFGKNYLLFEVSYVNPPDNLSHLIFQMIASGYRPVLAHPERYAFWTRKFDIYKELKEKGVMLQLNINSLTGYYSEDTRITAERLINENMIDMLGSDCHHAGHVNLIRTSARYKKALHQLLESGRLLNASL